MPNRSTVLATVPMLLRTARRTYAAAIRAELNLAGFDDLPRLNGQYVIRAMVHGSPPLSEIARELAVSKQAASKLIDLLVVRGFLARTADPVDRRRITLALTDRGRDAAKVIDVGTTHVDDALAARLSPRQMAGFRAGLNVLVELYPEYLSALAASEPTAVDEPVE
jgi:DNA-binding MarR family transcriptional regulator